MIEKRVGLIVQIEVLLKERFALEGEITPETRIQDDLALDSVDLIGMVQAVEEQFGVELSFASGEQIETVGGLASRISELQGEPYGV